MEQRSSIATSIGAESGCPNLRPLDAMSGRSGPAHGLRGGSGEGGSGKRADPWMPCDAARQNVDSMAASESTWLFPRTTESAQRDTEPPRLGTPRARPRAPTARLREGGGLPWRPLPAP